MIFQNSYGTYYVAQTNERQIDTEVDGKNRGFCLVPNPDGSFYFYKTTFHPLKQIQAHKELPSLKIPTHLTNLGGTGKMHFSKLSGRLCILLDPHLPNYGECQVINLFDPKGYDGPGQIMRSNIKNLELVPKGFEFELENPFYKKYE